mmetsp:Transcript_1843/g.6340  ORF Transcript_1843/g.6340 Transcript_1843/m.6340 type:complete len:400 (-) Transcript_1843:1912-3111(-)
MFRGVLGVIHVLRKGFDNLRFDVVLVVLEQQTHEVAFAQHLLRRVPVRFFPQQQTNRLHGHLHQRRGFGEPLHLYDVCFVQRVQRFHRAFKRGHGFVEIRLRGRRDEFRFLRLFRRHGFLRRDRGFHKRRLFLVPGDLHQEYLRRRGFFLQNGLQLAEFYFHSRNEGVCFVQLLQPVQQPVARAAQLGSFLIKQARVQVDQIQVRLRGDVEASPQFVVKRLAGFRDADVNINAHGRHRLPHVVAAQLDSRQKPLAHRVQRLRGPLHVPVDRAAVDQAGELPAPAPERLTHRGHAQDDVQVIPDAVDEGVVQGVFGHAHAKGFGVLPDVGTHPVFFGLVEKRGDLATVQDVVDILHETLGHDLRIGKQKHGRHAVDAGLLVQVFQVVPELAKPVPAAQLD